MTLMDFEGNRILHQAIRMEQQSDLSGLEDGA